MIRVFLSHAVKTKKGQGLEGVGPLWALRLHGVVQGDRAANRKVRTKETSPRAASVVKQESLHQRILSFPVVIFIISKEP